MAVLEQSSGFDYDATSQFLNRLVDLVPAKYYFEPKEDLIPTKYLKKSAKADAKRQLKEAYRQSKRAKLDPEVAVTSLEVQRQQAAAAAAARAGGDGGSGEGLEWTAEARSENDRSGAGAGEAGEGASGEPALQLNLQANSASREELAERLAAKLAVLRAQRKQAEQAGQAAAGSKGNAAKDWRDQTLSKSRERLVQEQQRRALQKSSAEAKQQQQAQQQAQAQPPLDDVNLAFGKVDLGDGGGRQRKPKQAGKKLNTAQLLAGAEQKEAERAALAGTDEGKEQLKREAWGSALARAKGERVLDNPALLRKSLKKEMKVKQKKTKQWKVRESEQRKEMKQKQAKRTDNLQARSQAKADKKRERREAKLLRPGFEGRKEGFINSKP